MLEDTIRFQSETTGQVINLSTKTFCRETFELLNKSIKFCYNKKTANKDTKNMQFEDFFR